MCAVMGVADFAILQKQTGEPLRFSCLHFCFRINPTSIGIASIQIRKSRNTFSYHLSYAYKEQVTLYYLRLKIFTSSIRI